MLKSLLASYRKRHNLTLSDMEERTGVSRVTLHRFEHDRVISHKSYLKIWEFLVGRKGLKGCADLKRIYEN